MKLKMLGFGILALATLPSCMHPVDQVLRARAEEKALQFEARGTVAQGACDDVGQYAAQRVNMGGLTMQPIAESTMTASAQGLH